MIRLIIVKDIPRLKSKTNPLEKRIQKKFKEDARKIKKIKK